jgi:hypothetical protein
MNRLAQIEKGIQRKRAGQTKRQTQTCNALENRSTDILKLFA